VRPRPESILDVSQRPDELLAGRSLAFVTDSPALDILQKRLLDRLWQFQEDKALCRIKVIFATLVHDPEISVRFDVFVWQHTVDLVQLQGRRVSIVVDADGELDALFFISHVFSPDIAFV
jgi:hypothetical protein